MQNRTKFAVMCLCISAAGALSSCGNSLPGVSATTSGGNGGHLAPASLGNGSCQASGLSGGSTVGQIAVQGASCSTASSVEQGAASAKGSSYTASGFTCSATKEGAGSPWSPAWGGTYYAYSCASGSEQVAFNWGTDYIYGGSSSSTTSGGSSQTTTGGALVPTPIGGGDCVYQGFPDGSDAAQVAAKNASCSTANTVEKPADVSQGADYSTDGFTCTATKQGPGSEWASAWNGAYYSYSCRNGSQQVAFNWGPHYA